MIFYCDLQGNLKAFQNETVYQGSNNVTTIYVVAPFSRPVGLNISFTKPNKLVTSPAVMKWVGTLGNVKIPVSFVNIPEQFTDTYNVWAYALPYSITEQNGVVGVSVNAVIADSVDASGQQAYKGNLTTFTGQFTVAYSALPSPPTDIPTEWTQDKVLDLLNNYYNDAIQKIGEMNTLKTDAKDTLVKAINEVFDEIASTNATIGDLSTLTTDEKTTIVGAINEVDNHTDNAQQTADNATTLANTGISIAEQAQTTANNAVATANEAKTIAEQAKTIATNSVYSVSFEDIQSAVTALNGYDNAYFKVGNSIYLKQKDVPDMWVYAVASEYVEYTYTTDDDFVNALLLGTVQVGYYVLANLESTGDYDVLKNKPIINQDLSADGFTPVENTYYRHMGTTSATYTAGVIYFYNGTAYKAIDGAGGETPTALPQEASALKNGNLPTSGWGSSSALWTGSVVTPYNPPSPSDPNMGFLPYTFNNVTDMLAFYGTKDDWSIVIDGKRVGASEFRASSDYPREAVEAGFSGGYTCYIRIFDTGAMVCWYNTKAGTITEVSNTKLAKPIYTISDTSITANSDILMELTDEGGVKAYSMEAGKMTVIRDTVPTQAIPYTYKVKQTNASGQFTVINHYVPKVEIPTIPTKTSELINDSGYVSNLPIVRNVVCNDVDSAAMLDTTITCEVGDLILAQIIVRSALTLPTEWTLLRTIPAIETTNNQTLSFAYKKATSTSETLTVTQATAGRIYTNLVRLSNAVSISYIQSCEKTGTGIKSISSTKPVTPNTVIWGASSTLWQTSSPYENWSSSPSTLDYYSVPQATRQPRLGTFVDSSGAGERTFTANFISDSSSAMMCGAVEIVGDEVARKGDIPTSLPVTYKKASGSLPTTGWGYSGEDTLWEGSYEIPANTSGYRTILSAGALDFDGLKGNKEPSDWLILGSTLSSYSQPAKVSSDTDGIYLKFFNQTRSPYFKIASDGSLQCNSGGYSAEHFNGIKTTKGVLIYSISDNTITINSSVKMYLTDENDVKPYNKVDGSIIVTRNVVPTQPIPYKYEVEQTSTEGLFEVINAYVPTKTSELTNDSGFITAADIGNALYPVGSIYMSVNNTNPSTFFGGTWEAWGAGKVPVGVDTADTDFNAVEKTGGEKTHTLTVNEMPKHSHSLPTFYSNPEKENITFADSAFNADKASDGNVSNGGQVISTGGGQAHNNLQPYITCYMWKRTA